MTNPVSIISEKIVHTLNSMVYLATRCGRSNAASSHDISRSLGELAPVHADIYHQGMVERALDDLHREGRVARSGGLWYRA